MPTGEIGEVSIRPENMLRLAASRMGRGIAARGVALQTRRCLVTKFSKVRALS